MSLDGVFVHKKLLFAYVKLTRTIKKHTSPWQPQTHEQSTRRTLVEFLGFKKLLVNTVHVDFDMGVSKNSGIPKWMVYNGKPY